MLLSNIYPIQNIDIFSFFAEATITFSILVFVGESNFQFKKIPMKQTRRESTRLSTSLLIMQKKFNNTFSYNSEGLHLPSDLKAMFNRQQLNHYDFLEIETFELFKFIKTELPNNNYKQIRGFMENVQGVMNQLQKFCRSLNLYLVFKIFDKLYLCLRYLSSHLILLFKDKQQASKLSKHHQLISKTQQHIDQYIKNKVIPQDKRIPKFGGVSLYNQNYTNHMEAGHTFLKLLDELQQTRTEKWQEIQQMQNFLIDKQQNINKQISELKENSSHINQIKYENFFNQIGWNDFEQKSSTKFNLCNVERTYKMEKNKSIEGISKLIKEMQRIHNDEVKNLHVIIENKEIQIKRLIEMRSKYNKKIGAYCQTDPDPQIEQNLTKLELQQNHIVNLENSNHDMLAMLKKSKNQIVSLQQNQKQLMKIICDLKKEIEVKALHIANQSDKVNILKSMHSIMKQNHIIDNKATRQQFMEQDDVSNMNSMHRTTEKGSEISGSIACLTLKNIKSQKHISTRRNKPKVFFCKSVHHIDRINQNQSLQQNNQIVKPSTLRGPSVKPKVHTDINDCEDLQKNSENSMQRQDKKQRNKQQDEANEIKKKKENKNRSAKKTAKIPKQIGLNIEKKNLKNIIRKTVNTRSNQKGQKMKKINLEPILDSKHDSHEKQKLNNPFIQELEQRYNDSRMDTIHEIQPKHQLKQPPLKGKIGPNYILKKGFFKGQKGNQNHKISRLGIGGKQKFEGESLLSEPKQNKEKSNLSMQQKTQKGEKIVKKSMVNLRYHFKQGQSKISIDNQPSFEQII